MIFLRTTDLSKGLPREREREKEVYGNVTLATKRRTMLYPSLLVVTFIFVEKLTTAADSAYNSSVCVCAIRQEWTTDKEKRAHRSEGGMGGGGVRVACDVTQWLIRVSKGKELAK